MLEGEWVVAGMGGCDVVDRVLESWVGLSVAWLAVGVVGLLAEWVDVKRC